MEDALSSQDMQSELLDFVGLAAESQVLRFDLHENKWDPDSIPENPRKRRELPSNHPKKCVVLVPTHEQIPVACDLALIELERRGYIVRRLPGFAAIDQARNVLASEALIDGFEETMWIDSDIEFDPDDIEKLRQHELPIVSGVYAKKGRRAIASHLLPDTDSLNFGEQGGLHEIMYAATGFLHVRREVYERIQLHLNLPICNELFDERVIPFFWPLIRKATVGQWYLPEDYAFSERARLAGYKIIADTTIRLWHLGTYQYGWEDVGRKPDRRESIRVSFSSAPNEDRYSK